MFENHMIQKFQINCVSISLSVNYRMFGVTPRMEPVERDDTTETDASITIEIVVFCFIFDKQIIEFNTHNM